MAWFNDGSAKCESLSWQWTAAALQSYSGMSLNESSGGKYSRGRTSGTASGCPIHREGKMV